MESLSLYILVGAVLSLGAFLYFESLSLKAHRITKEESSSLSESFKHYNTSRNVVFFFIASYVITLIISILGHNEHYGLIEAIAYIFTTAFSGSIIIFVMKIQRSLLIKVFATFLYGVPYIGASALAFLTTYIIKGM
ncbi:MAG: hypothetical protein JJW00_01790 [Sulfurimonas sp.]|nr:hypothetical protein [Sulfurimonas sp.]